MSANDSHLRAQIGAEAKCRAQCAAILPQTPSRLRRSDSGGTNLLPQPHDLEALEVVERPALGDSVLVLRPCALAELLLDLGGLPDLLNDTVASTAGELGDDDGSQGQVGEGRSVTGHSLLGGGSGAIDENLRECEYSTPYFGDRAAQHDGWRRGRSTYALVVDDLDDGGKPALEGALGEEDHTADLNEPPLRCLDLCVTHCC